MSRKKRLKLVTSQTYIVQEEQESKHKIKLADLKEIWALHDLEKVLITS